VGGQRKKLILSSSPTSIRRIRIHPILDFSVIVSPERRAEAQNKNESLFYEAFGSFDKWNSSRFVDTGTTAQTVDLSLTGLASKTISEFEMGQRLRISLKFPDESSNLDARARVIRDAEDDSGDPRTTYGTEYVDPPRSSPGC
jgi:hypothetical protein